MDDIIKVTSLAFVVGCAGITYYVFTRKKHKFEDAANAFKYLTIKVVTTDKDCEQIVYEILKCKKYRAIGFDCEWVSEQGKRHPVALLQLSTYDGLCVLFRLNLLKHIPEPLQVLLEDENIYKLGVAPADDAKYLFEDYSVVLKSILDIRHIAQICGHTPGGLAALSRNHLGVTLDKSWRIRCSDWEAEVLTGRQTVYAAADAHVAIRIFVKLLTEYGSSGFMSFLRRKSSTPSWDSLEESFKKYVDLGFKPSKMGTRNGNVTTKEILSNSKRYPNATRTKPLYHNCFLQAPDGELLCTCDHKKAYWYVEKQLAHVVQQEPLTIRLRFEPAGRSVGDVGRYYQLTKENKCVVCGSTNSYIRKNVVPREYRKCFPEIMKDHSSHDVVLLCSSCHQQSNTKDLALRQTLAAVCCAPISSQGRNSKCLEDAHAKKIRSAARALLSKKHVLPAARRRDLELEVMQQFPGHALLTPQLLEMAASTQVTYENSSYEPHGERVVEHYLAREGGLLRLEEEWRQHFLHTMRPKYLPNLWSVKHNEERLRVKLEEGRLSKEDLKSIGVTNLTKSERSPHH